jgi:hypothetical protein
MNKEQKVEKKKNKKIGLIQKFGVGAFFFFLAKGLVWLAIFFGAKELIFS